MTRQTQRAIIRAMRLRTRHRRFIAFLAIAALWLLVAAPVISQVLQARATYSELGIYCDGMAGMSDHGSMAMPDHGDMAMPDHDGSMAACGYCGLFAHATTIPGAVYVAMFVPSTPHWAVPVPAPPIPAAPRRLDAAPRGPPVSLHA